MNRDASRPPAVMPVFPLAEVVFFPRTVLPLRVASRRHLQLVQEAPNHDRWLAVPQLVPGSGEDPPLFYPVAGAGRIVQFLPEGDDACLVQVEGLVRVRLEEVASDRLYRFARVHPEVEDPAWLVAPEAEETLGRILDLAVRVGLVSREEGAGGVPSSPARRGALVNRIASRVLADPVERQELLEAAGFAQRVLLLARQLRIMAHATFALERIPSPRDPEVN